MLSEEIVSLASFIEGAVAIMMMMMMIMMMITAFAAMNVPSANKNLKMMH